MNRKNLVITLLFLFLQLIPLTLSQNSDTELSDDPTNDATNPPSAYSGVDDATKLFPMKPVEVVGLIIIVLISGLANAGGIGGGTLMTSVLIMFFYYTENTALTVVYTLVFGGSLGNYINVARRRDRRTGKPLVDYDLAMICMPPMVLGTNIGVILGRVSAPIVILLGIISVTIYTITKISKRARKQYAQETREINNSEPLLSPRMHSDVEWREKWMESFQSSTDCIVDPKVQKILCEEQRLFPAKKLAILIGLLVICMLFAIFRGTNRMESPIGVTYCQVGYWTLFFLGLGICTLILLLNQRLVRTQIKLKKDHDIDTTVGEFQINSENIPKLIVLSVTAGVLAGLLGMGGGMIMNPTLLTLGIPPQNLAATTGFFVVQTSFISLFQATLYGDVPIFEQVFFFIVSLIGSFGVSYFLSWLVKKRQRPSLILFALVVILSLSLVATPAFELYHNFKNIKHLVKFKPIC